MKYLSKKSDDVYHYDNGTVSFDVVRHQLTQADRKAGRSQRRRSIPPVMWTADVADKIFDGETKPQVVRAVLDDMAEGLADHRAIGTPDDFQPFMVAKELATEAQRLYDAIDFTNYSEVDMEVIEMHIQMKCVKHLEARLRRELGHSFDEARQAIRILRKAAGEST